MVNFLCEVRTELLRIITKSPKIQTAKLEATYNWSITKPE